LNRTLNVRFSLCTFSLACERTRGSLAIFWRHISLQVRKTWMHRSLLFSTHFASSTIRVVSCGGAHEGQVVIAFPRELREGENTLSSQIWNILVTTRQNQIRIFHPTLYRMCRGQEQGTRVGTLMFRVSKYINHKQGAGFGTFTFKVQKYCRVYYELVTRIGTRMLCIQK
jgi:hypothetical protein